MSERLSDGHIRVLIVDDESNLLELARLFLERSMDIKADGATSGEMALQMMRGTVYDVVVSDYQMPSMDGLQLLQALKFYGSDVPFILFTGKGREDIAVAALNLGAAFYLQKGGDPKTQFAELSNMVRRAAVNRTAEKRLVESEDKFRTIFQESPDIYLLIRDGVIIDCNRAAETQFGMPRNEIIGKTPCDLSPPMQPNGASSKELVYHLINKVGSSGSTKFEWLHRRSNGTDFYSDICLMPLKMSGEGFLIATIRDITSRKIAESQLRASEEMFRSVVTSTDAISFVVDSNGTISLLEGKGLARLGLEPGSMVGRNASGLFIGIDSMHLGLKEAAAGNMVRFETDYRDMRYDVVLTPLRREDGEVAHIIGIANDITERAMIDQEREQNSMRIQALRELNQMSDRPLNELAAFAMERAVRLTNSSIGYIAFVNEDESVLSMHAWSKEAMSGCMVEDGPFDYPVARTGLWGEAVRQRRPIITNDYAAPNQLEKDIPGGHVRLRRHMNVPVFDKGRIVIVAGVGNKQKDYDLTDVRELTLLMEGMWRLVRRKRAEDALRESDKRLSDVIDLLPDPSLVVNHDGVVIAWNKAMTALTGVEAEEMLGKGDKEYALPFYGRRRPLLIDFVLSGDKDVLSWYSHPFLEGNIITAETIPIRLKGKDVMLWARASPFFDDQGRLLGAIETVRDVTEWKRTEMALKQTNRQLNTLADITRHDILNTLTVLRGRVDLAEMRTADPAFISHLKQEDALLQKIEDQIMFTKLYQSLGLSEPTWQALAAIVDGLEPRRDIEIINDCDTFEVFADPMLPRAFDNLFDNAVRHGRHVSTIRVSSKPDGDKLLIRFEDDGCGVPNKEKELIFERGYGRNTGLGLFLVKEILAITGLSISESGEEGRGAVFEISVPLANYRTIK